MRRVVCRSLLAAVAFLCAPLLGDDGKSIDDYVSGSLTIDYETKAFTYGLVDSDDPVFMPYGSLTFFDTFTFGSLFIIDTSHYSEKVGRGDRAWDFWEIDFPVDLRHTFTADEFDWLPTSVEIGVGYRYEYHPRRSNCHDTQFWVFDVALPDLWLVPRFAYERDTINDNGTYLNLNLSHTFQIAEDVDFTLGVGQGFGDERRVKGYLCKDDWEPLEKAGLMDTSVKAELGWTITEWMRITGFVAYYDFLFDRKIRHASRLYQPRNAGGHGSDTSWHFAAGVAVTFLF